MSFQFLARRSLPAFKQSLKSALSHSSSAAGAIRNSSSSLFRLRPLVAAASASYFRCRVPGFSARSFVAHLSLDEPTDPANFPPKEQILIAGCDFEHWFVLMDDPEGDATREEIIDSYIKTLAKVIGSEEEARMKMYSVSTRHYYAFGAVISQELSEKLKGLPGVRWVLPDSYLDRETKNYGGEPFINGEAVPYDPKYHEDWLNIENHNDRPETGSSKRPRNSG